MAGHKHKPCNCWRKSMAGKLAAAAARREEYLRFRYAPEWGLSRQESAGLVGVCERTAERYERWNREQG